MIRVKQLYNEKQLLPDVSIINVFPTKNYHPNGSAVEKFKTCVSATQQNMCSVVSNRQEHGTTENILRNPQLILL